MSPTVVTPVPTGTWSVDPVHSVVGFRVRHFGISWLRGRFDRFDVTLDATDDARLHLRGSAPVESIAIPNEQLHGHLMSPDFFDAQLHPILSFEADDVELSPDGSAKVRGAITMRGTTNPIELTGSWTGPVQGMAGDERIGLELSGRLDRTAFGISWAAKLAGGNDVVGNTVQIDAELELVRS